MEKERIRVMLECSKRAVKPGEWASWRLVYQAGKEGLASGGGLRIVIPPTATEPQFSCPTAPGYTTVSVKNPHIRVSVFRDIDPVLKHLIGGVPQWKEVLISLPKIELKIILEGEGLKEGEGIFITYGDMSEGSPGARLENHLDVYEYEVEVFEDTAGNGNFVPFFPPPVIKLQRDNPRLMKAFIPSQAVDGRPVNLTVSLFDHRGLDLPGKSGDVTLAISDGETVLSDNCHLKSENNNHGSFGIKLAGSGVRRLTVTDRSGKFACKTNPVRLSAEPQKLNIYWGEIHSHTGLSTCGKLARNKNRPENCYRYARDVVGLDFAVVMDHGKNQNYDNPNDPHMTDEEWGIVCDTAARFNRSGSFVTFSGYEWASEIFGDRSIYFLKDDMSMSRTGKLRELWDFYRGSETIIVPHHVAVMRPVNWDYHDEEMEPLVEIYSEHGRCEYFGNYPYTPAREMVRGHSVQDALARGHKLGIVSGSDDHSGRAGNFGITAVLALNLTREELFAALRQRRCYGTTNARIILHFEIDGLLMGEIGSGRKRPEVKADVIGTSKIEKIELIKNNETVFVQPGGSTEHEHLSYTDSAGYGQSSFYYLRVTQEDGEMAWSSPIWLYQGR